MNKPVSTSPADEVAEFLQFINPEGPWAVARIHPDSGKTSGELLSSLDDVREWVSRWEGKQNLYYRAQVISSVNPETGMPRKENVDRLVVGQQLDVDCDKQGGGQAEWDEAKRAVTARLIDGDVAPGAPSLIIDTGGGIQALWLLTEPYDATSDNVDSVEGASRHAASDFEAEGGDACWAINHLLRLPGCMNLPNQAKRRRGRKPVRSKLIHREPDARYDLVDFPYMEPKAAKVDVDYQLGAPEFTEDADALMLEFDLSADTLSIIETGFPTSPKADKSRSEYLWRACCDMLRRNVPPEVVYGLLVDPQWGIHEHIHDARHDDDQRDAYARKQVLSAMGHIEAERQRKREQLAEEFASPPDMPMKETPHSYGGLSFKRASEFEAKPLKPLWPGRIYMGKLTTCAGEPDQGKSVWTCDTAARITRGAEWPDGSGRAPKGMVIMLSAEDDPEDTIVPRLMAAGADLDKVIILQSLVQTRDGKRMFSLARDLAKLRGLLKRHPDVVALFVDPVNAYLGTSADTDTFKDADVRAVLGPVKELVEEFGFAGIIVTHFKKGGTGRAIDRVMGSVAFTGLSRSSWAFIAEKDNNGEPTGRKLMAKIKQNIAEAADAIAYRLVGRLVGDGIEAPKVEWEETIKGSADELMEGRKRGSPKLSAAVAFLIDQLEDGPMQAGELLRLAKEAGHSEKTLNRGKEELGVISYKPDGETAWHWRLESTTEDAGG